MSRFTDKMQQAVADFHAAMGQPVGDTSKPALVEHRLRLGLIFEECEELREAIERDDLVEAIDGACDLIYVVLGTMVSAGVDLAPFFDEVHRSNMAKVGGKRREDGKILKPEGWMPPDIAGLLAKATATLPDPFERCVYCDDWTRHRHRFYETDEEDSALCRSPLCREKAANMEARW